MKKTLVYVLLLAVLGGAVWYFLFRNNDNVFGVSEAGFNIKDTASIGKIFMASKDGEAIELQRTDSGWIVNGKYKVLQSTLQQLMETLAGQLPAYPATAKMHNLVVQSLASDGIKVEVFNRKGERMRLFYVGNEGPDFDGNYMLMDGARDPFVVKLPGHMGYLKPRYSTDLMVWRDRHVFMHDAGTIRSVSVQYEGAPDSSFVIAQDGGRVTVSSPGLPAGAVLNDKRARAYLGFFGNVYSDGYVNGTYKLDSVIASTEKFGSIELKSDKGTERVDVYYMPITRRSKNLVIDSLGYASDRYDADNFYAVVNGGQDTIIIQKLSFQKLFRSGPEFFRPDEPATQ